jgi:hypothetical protein
MAYTLKAREPTVFWCSRCRFDHAGECATTLAAKVTSGVYVMAVSKEPGMSGLPAMCLDCGKDKGRKSYVCQACERAWSSTTDEHIRMWESGVREFPHLSKKSWDSYLPADALPRDYTTPWNVGDIIASCSSANSKVVFKVIGALDASGYHMVEVLAGIGNWASLNMGKTVKIGRDSLLGEFSKRVA